MSAWLRWRAPLDRAVAALLVVLLAPVALAAGAVLRVAHGAPVMIRLDRVGVDGERFRMWKVRTMVPSTPDGRAAGAAITAGDDARVTEIGRILRRWRLDELPQLLNIVAGEMALIGPRPETPEYVDGASSRWRHVLLARPGILGPTQLIAHEWEQALSGPSSGRRYRDEVLPLKLAIDEWYVRHASPRIDALVLRELVRSFFSGRSPRTLRARVERDVVELRGAPR